jgi:hypothetical protein
MIVMKFGGTSVNRPRPSNASRHRQSARRSHTHRSGVRDGQDDQQAARHRQRRDLGKREEFIRQSTTFAIFIPAKRAR